MDDLGSKSKLTTEEQYELILELCQAVVVTKNTKEAAHLWQDLLSKSEVEMIAKRLKIAKLLLEGLTFDEIRKSLKAGRTTISKINCWLNLSGNGYRLVAERTKQSPPSVSREAIKDIWRMMKRRYPSYLWPEILIEDIFKNASNEQQNEIIKIIKKFAKKKSIFAEIEAENLTKYARISRHEKRNNK